MDDMTKRTLQPSPKRLHPPAIHLPEIRPATIICASVFALVFLYAVAPNQANAQSEESPPPEATGEQNPESEEAEQSGEEDGFFGGVFGGSEEDEGDGLFTGLMLDGFKAIMGLVYEETVGDLLGKVGGALQVQLLGLPVPKGEVVEMYDSMTDAMRPAILVGILVTALIMMVRTASHDVAYAGFSALPKLLGIGIAFAFLPQFMQILAFMTADVSGVFLPSGAQAGEAGVELFKTAVVNLGGSGAVNLLLAVAFVFVGFMVVLVSILKNVMFYLLFIAGPFALAASILPQTAGLAASWFRGVLACAAIPILWSIELGMGSVIVASPQVMFGEMASVFGSWGDGVFTSVGAIVILWIMYKTPFKVLEWAFESYDSRHGPWRGIAKSLVVGTALHGIKTAMSGAAGGGAGVAAAHVSSTANSQAGFASGSSTGSEPRGARSIAGSGMRAGIGGGRVSGSSRSLAAGSVSSGEKGLGSGASHDYPTRLSSTANGGGSRQQALPQGKQQLALPAPSPAIEKFLKKDGTSPGMGQPDIRSHNKKKYGKHD